MSSPPLYPTTWGNTEVCMLYLIISASMRQGLSLLVGLQGAVLLGQGVLERQCAGGHYI